MPIEQIDFLVNLGLALLIFFIGLFSNYILRCNWVTNWLNNLPILKRFPNRIEEIIRSITKNIRLTGFTLPIFILINNLGLITIVLNLLTIKIITDLSIIGEKLLGDLFVNLSDNEQQRQRRLTLTPPILVIMKWITIITGGIFTLYALNINPTPLLGGIGILSLILGFGARNILNDIFSGLFILFEDYFRVGDLVSFNGFTGSVIEFSLRSTRLKSNTGEILVYPNGSIQKISKKYALINDIFITYSRRDKEFVDKLHYFLKKSGHDAWIDFEDIPHGSSWEREIIKAIDSCTYVLIIVSNNYLKSEQCAREAVYFNARKKKIIPLIITEPNYEKIPYWISSKNFIFFTEEYSFEGSFRNLLKTINEID